MFSRISSLKNAGAIFFGALFFCLLSGCKNDTGADAADFKVLQINAWMNGTRAPNAAENLTALIAKTQPDAVLLCELGTDEKLIRQIAANLDEQGLKYHCDGLKMQTAILSKIPFDKTEILFVTDDSPDAAIRAHRAITKAQVSFNRRKIVLYAAHLDWQHYAPYLPRGYDAQNWGKKLMAPIVESQKILEENRRAFREEAVKNLIPEMQRERAQNRVVIFGGDLNEPSHLDWQADTKNLFDHAGAIVNWEVSLLLKNAGFIDTYREKFPNAATHPGFTWTPVVGQDVVKNGDERDRIDFIYYAPEKGVILREAKIVGPVETALHGTAVPEKQREGILVFPLEQWPSDHKASFAIFEIAN